MKKTMKTNEVLMIYDIINTAKYGKMEDEDKIKVWKISRSLKPIATKFQEEINDAVEKFRPGGDFSEKMQKAQEYNRLHEKNEPTADIMSQEDYEAFSKELDAYKKLVDNAVNESARKDVEIDIVPISEEAFEKLIIDNNWTMGQVTALSEVICG